MKLVTAVVQPFAVADVRAALDRMGIAAETVSEVSGVGRQRGHTEIYRGADYRVDLVPKVRVEVVVADEAVEQVLAELTAAARTGRIGDGKVWVTTISTVAERGAGAR
ncbi:P-II family nitrogen regulator [Pseudonocardia sp. CA-107938]|uniref:P-II family nitrogen regulator n=1 Tax=Pseudonocardia sp. CA-107938 TaxID=3240021 RepID=UPI003D89E2BE